MAHNFADHVQKTCDLHATDVVLLLRPLKTEMPVPMHWHDDPFFPFSKAIIGATRDVVMGYMFDFPAFMAHGAAGAVALERSIAYIGGDHIKILHGPFTGDAYTPMIYENAFNADAATVSFETDIAIYTEQPEHGVFLVQSGEPADTFLPTYWIDADSLILPGVMQIRLAGQNILYTSYGDDYATRCRQAIEEMK